MSEHSGDARGYHHGDLRRALVEAARRLIVEQGVAALSLRATAREAGVSAGAPYHHFKDKNELLDAVAREGWTQLSKAVAAARAECEDQSRLLSTLGLAYVRFARDNPALYQLMYDRIRDKESVPHGQGAEAYDLVKNAVRRHAGQSVSGVDLELAAFAFWCVSHGLAAMRGFPRLARLKEVVGGDDAFITAVLDHLPLFGAGGGKPGSQGPTSA